MSPQRYLADSAAAAAAVGDFSDALAGIAPTPTVRTLRAAFPRLDADADRASAIIQRIRDERLEDRRLEQQRARAADALGDVETTMRLVADRARTGTPAGVADAASRYSDAVAGLKDIASGS